MRRRRGREERRELKHRVGGGKGAKKYICIRPYRASDSSVPESSPLWNVDCFSLSARPQVRWRERRRCDYQPAASAVPRDDDCNKRLASEDQQPQQTMQVIAAARPDNHGNNNHTRVLIKRDGADDSSHDECDQTQC